METHDLKHLVHPWHGVQMIGQYKRTVRITLFVTPTTMHWPAPYDLLMAYSMEVLPGGPLAVMAAETYCTAALLEMAQALGLDVPHPYPTAKA